MLNQVEIQTPSSVFDYPAECNIKNVEQKLNLNAIDKLINTNILLSQTPQVWINQVLADFPLFLADHASNERKAASIAMELVVRYPDKSSLIKVAVGIAQDELEHFAAVHEKMVLLSYPLQSDEKCSYARYMHRHASRGGQERLLDQMMIASMIEFRGMERFGLVAIHHPNPQWQYFFQKLSLGEKGHANVYIHEAKKIFDARMVDETLQKWLSIENEAFKLSFDNHRLFS